MNANAAWTVVVVAVCAVFAIEAIFGDNRETAVSGCRVQSDTVAELTECLRAIYGDNK